MLIPLTKPQQRENFFWCETTLCKKLFFRQLPLREKLFLLERRLLFYTILLSGNLFFNAQLFLDATLLF